MKQQVSRLAVTIAIAVPVWVGSLRARAQLIPDNTLGSESSIVVPSSSGGASDRIEGGAIRDETLFHSFEEFNIGAGQAVYFSPPVEIQTIFTRVTGGNLSQISGILGVLGNSNLFFLNPNGIIFDSNAQLDLRGSFFATTASRLAFGSQFEFSATDPSAPPLLVLAEPDRLFFGTAAGKITNRSLGRGLEVPPGQTLTLLGGEIALEEESGLTAESGRIELGSIASNAVVEISPGNPGWVLSYDSTEALGTITLTGTTVDASSDDGFPDFSGGAASDLTTDAGTDFFGGAAEDLDADADTDFFGGAAGDLDADADTDFFGGAAGDLDADADTDFFGGAIEDAFGDVSSGFADPLPSGEVRVRAARLTMTRSNIFSLNLGSAPGGSISIETSETIRLDAASDIATGALAGGRGGTIEMTTERLEVNNGSRVLAEAFGLADGGDLTVRASESAIVSGASSSTQLPTQLSTQTLGDGDGGRLQVNTPHLSLLDGGQLTTSAEAGAGSGGILRVEAETVEISGSGVLDDNLVPSGLLSESDSFAAIGTGRGGSIEVRGDRLTIRDGGTISSSATAISEGAAGSIDIDVSEIELSDRATIAATTQAGEGNISLRADELVMRQESRVTTDAAGTAIGGQITIDADVLVGLENSDITANALAGSGGLIAIDSDAILGFQPRTRAEIQATLGTDDLSDFSLSQFPSSDIASFTQDPNAAAALEQDRLGIQDPDADPGRDALRLPAGVVETDTAIATACPADAGSYFALTGRGGLPPDPRRTLSDRTLWRPSPQLAAAKDAIAEARGWITRHDGTVVLSATPAADRAEYLIEQGAEQFARGDAAGALERWQQAAAAYADANDDRGRLGSQLNQSQALRELGFYRRSRALLADVNSQLDFLADSELKVKAERLFGIALYQTGELDAADRQLQGSLEMARRLALEGEIARSSLELGYLARLRWQSDRDREKTPEIEPILALYREAARLGDRRVQLRSQLEQLSLEVEVGRYDRALPLFFEARSQLETLGGDPPARINFAEIWLRLFAERITSDADAIAQFLAPTLRLARDSGDARAESYALGQLGRLYELDTRYAEAIALTQEAINRAEAIAAPEIAVLWQWQLGRLRARSGERDGAIAAYKAAVASLEGLRRDLSSANPEVRFAFRDRVEPVYRQLVQLLLDGEPTTAQLKQARAAIEALQLAEIDNFFRDPCTRARPQSIEAIDRSAAVVYPIVLSDRLAVILSLPDGSVRHYATPLPNGEATLVQAQRDLLVALRPPSGAQDDSLQPHQQFYDWLIRPATAELERQQVQTLTFVLDGILRSVPMAVLHDGDRYLVEKYRLALTPGLQLAGARSRSQPDLEVLAGGLAESRQGFSPLPSVRQELEQLQTLVPAATLLDREFTKPQLQQAVASSSSPIVHLATHGQFSSQAEETFLLTWDGRMDVRELSTLLQVREHPDRPAIELLVLSACQTAAGDDRAALGMAGMAVRSGARSTLATLWNVSDESTAELIAQFYARLREPGTTKAEALRQAQLSLLGDREYSHPFFWGAFVLVGNWL